jgi:phosphoglycolate phosphatase
MQRLRKNEADQAHQLFLRAYADSHALSTVYPGVRECPGLAAAQQVVSWRWSPTSPTSLSLRCCWKRAWPDYFRWTLGGDSLPQQKPDPAALLWVMEQARVDAGAGTVRRRLAQ